MEYINETELTRNFEDGVKKSKSNQLPLYSVYLDKDEVLRYIDRIDKNTEIVLNMIAKNIFNINLDLFKKDDDLYDIALNILYDVLLEFKVPTNEFLNNIIDDLNKSTKLDWKVKNKEQKHVGYKTVGYHPLPLSAAIDTDISDVPITKTIYGKTESIYLVSEKLGTEVLYAQNNKGEYTPIDAINEDIFEYANINGFINNNLPKILKSSFGKNYLLYLRENKEKLNKDFINLFNRYVSILSSKKDNLEQTSKELKEAVNLIKKRQEESTITDEEYKKYDDLLYNDEYYEHQALASSLLIHSKVDSYERDRDNRKNIEERILGLVENDDNYEWDVTITYDLPLYKVYNSVCVKPPTEVMNLINLFNKYISPLKILFDYKYGKEHENDYDRHEYNSKLDYGDFWSETLFPIEFILDDKKLDLNTYKKYLCKIKEAIEKVKKLDIKQPVTNIDLSQVDISNMGSHLDEEDRDFFLSDIEDATSTATIEWYGLDDEEKIIDNLCEFVKNTVESLEEIINDYNDYKKRVEYMNNRAKFYDNLYKKYSLKLDLDNEIKKINKKEEKNDQEIDRLNNRISDILKIFNSNAQKTKSVAEIYYEREEKDIKATSEFLREKASQKKLVKKKEDQ